MWEGERRITSELSYAAWFLVVSSSNMLLVLLKEPNFGLTKTKGSELSIEQHWLYMNTVQFNLTWLNCFCAMAVLKKTKLIILLIDISMKEAWICLMVADYILIIEKLIVFRFLILFPTSLIICALHPMWVLMVNIPFRLIYTWIDL